MLCTMAAFGDELTPGLDVSTKKDALHAIDQGIEWLKARQNADGSWALAPKRPSWSWRAGTTAG